MTKADSAPEREPKKQRFVACITLPNGRKIWARDYGLRGFPIRDDK